MGLKKWGAMLWENATMQSNVGGLQGLRVALCWQPARTKGRQTKRNWFLPKTTWTCKTASGPERTTTQGHMDCSDGALQQRIRVSLLRPLMYRNYEKINSYFILLSLGYFVSQQCKTDRVEIMEMWLAGFWEVYVCVHARVSIGYSDQFVCTSVCSWPQ